MTFQRILIIQTAFIGDVVLATPLIEKLSAKFPNAKIDFLLRKGNESLLQDDGRINEILIWDKGESKNRELFRIIRLIRSRRYDLLINVQRFASTGLIAWLSRAKRKVGFDKNPFAFSYTLKKSHRIENGMHEVDRNISLIAELTDAERTRPQIMLSKETELQVREYKEEPFITLAPTSVWFTKQFPAHKWIEFLRTTDFAGNIYLLGGPSDKADCEHIRVESQNENVQNLCGELSLIQSVALMKGARMNYVNDSAPLHFASAVNAPVTAVFCSTVTSFGFGPLSDHAKVIEVEELDCRPCGLHGYKSCPKGHFRCAEDIEIGAL